jgi:hypothetical protein
MSAGHLPQWMWPSDHVKSGTVPWNTSRPFRTQSLLLNRTLASSVVNANLPLELMQKSINVHFDDQSWSFLSVSIRISDVTVYGIKKPGHVLSNVSWTVLFTTEFRADRFANPATRLFPRKKGGRSGTLSLHVSSANFEQNSSGLSVRFVSPQ